jgi:hypothetical protein
MMILGFGTSRQRARNMLGGVNPSYSQARYIRYLEVRSVILGGNLTRLHGIDIEERRH